ncbi:MAG: adenylosuccinate synthase [Dehalococcoidia bacterium]|nr:adenylosuccinate synthase [Dehalococcoidia bacterium]
MAVVAVIGGQWGDEGKGKIVDLMAESASFVVRFSGGDNAGHTVINPQGEFKLHLVPSGIFYPKTTAVIANGVAVNPGVLLDELRGLKECGVNTSNLMVSSRAHVIMPYHVLLDGLEEKARGAQAIGTTGKGIGPVFADKVARLGIRVVDLLNAESLRRRLKPILEQKNILLTKVYDTEPVSLDDTCEKYLEYGRELAPYVRDTEVVIQKAVQEGKSILLEGAQGALLDPDFGSYPYVTSSSPLIGGAVLGTGLDPRKIKHVIGVFKAYTTRVGGGPMPTELLDATGDMIRERAREYGTTTGRPRRCGWYDAVAAAFATRLNGFTGIALTRLDILDVLPTIKVCVGYEVDGSRINHFPCDLDTLSRCLPIYQETPGWMSPISEVRRYEDLPRQARGYVAKLEETTGCPVSLISVGPRREQTVKVRDIG